jgi:hypothetical protein
VTPAVFYAPPRPRRHAPIIVPNLPNCGGRTKLFDDLDLQPSRKEGLPSRRKKINAGDTVPLPFRGARLDDVFRRRVLSKDKTACHDRD